MISLGSDRHMRGLWRVSAELELGRTGRGDRPGFPHCHLFCHVGVLNTREDILIYSLAYRCCGNGRNTGQTRLHLQCGGNREFGFPCVSVCLFVCLAVCRSHMVKKHRRDEKGMRSELYPHKYTLLSCHSQTVMHAALLTAHSPRNTSTHMWPLFPPQIHPWSRGSPAALPLSKEAGLLLSKLQSPCAPDTL